MVAKFPVKMAQDSMGDKKAEVFDTMKEQRKKIKYRQLESTIQLGARLGKHCELIFQIHWKNQVFAFKVTVGTENGVISAATTSTQNYCILHFYMNTEQFPSLKMCLQYLGLTDNFHLKVI